MPFNIINKHTDFNLTEFKELIITPVVYGILKNKSNCAILLINHYKKHFMRLKHGLLLETASLYKNNINKHSSSLQEQFNSAQTILMLSHFADINMFTMKISQRLKKCSKVLLVTMLDITMHGGVLEILHTNNKSMIRQLKTLIKQSE